MDQIRHSSYESNILWPSVKLFAELSNDQKLSVFTSPSLKEISAGDDSTKSSEAVFNLNRPVPYTRLI